MPNTSESPNPSKAFLRMTITYEELWGRPMKTSALGKSLIKHNEVGNAGPLLTVKPDGDGFQIGYGHDLKSGERFPNGITAAYADTLLGHDVDQIDLVMQGLQSHGLIPADCTQNQWDALADFAYNDGDESLHIMLSHGWSRVTTQIPRWIYARQNGQLVESDALRIRRAAEVKLFSTPMEQVA